MIFALLVSGGIISRVFANWLAGNRTAILCMGSVVVVPVLGSLQLGDG